LKFKDERPFASVDAAVKKLLEIANGLEADHAGRLQIGMINRQFLEAGASVAEYKAAKGRSRTRAYRPASVRRVYDVHPGRRGPVRLMPAASVHKPVRLRANPYRSKPRRPTSLHVALSSPERRDDSRQTASAYSAPLLGPSLCEKGSRPTA
jgi:hypothetical protein